jgi:hypothetical protein
MLLLREASIFIGFFSLQKRHIPQAMFDPSILAAKIFISADSEQVV